MTFIFIDMKLLKDWLKKRKKKSIFIVKRMRSF